MRDVTSAAFKWYLQVWACACVWGFGTSLVLRCSVVVTVGLPSIDSGGLENSTGCFEFHFAATLPHTPFPPRSLRWQVGGALLAVNYPQRLQKAFLLNAPSWSGVIWKVLAAVIPRKTREGLQLFTRREKAAAAEALLTLVPADQLPEQYGGKASAPLRESQLELDMREYVRRINREHAAAGGAAAAAAS